MITAQNTAAREDFYRRIDAQNMSALWTVLDSLITPMPASLCRPAAWRFADIRRFMLEAGELITAREAERRVLVLENPGLRGRSSATTSVYAGVQLVLPGEVAPAHRHSQSALRFILEGSGAYTAVDGERTIMARGDFIITPSMTWHDHGNETEEPMFWLDGLDIPIVQFLDASFSERLGREQQTLARPIGHSFARFGHNLAPVDYTPSSQTSPIFSYPYDHTRAALDLLSRTQQWDPCHGLRMKYINPVTGSYAMPTLGAFIQMLPKGFTSVACRSTDATVFVVVEGSGRSRIGDMVHDWMPNDIMVAPSWSWVSHQADQEAVLFSCSDRPVQEKLDLFREERGIG